MLWIYRFEIQIQPKSQFKATIYRQPIKQQINISMTHSVLIIIGMERVFADCSRTIKSCTGWDDKDTLWWPSDSQWRTISFVVLGCARHKWLDHERTWDVTNIYENIEIHDTQRTTGSVVIECRIEPRTTDHIHYDSDIEGQYGDSLTLSCGEPGAVYALGAGLGHASWQMLMCWRRELQAISHWIYGARQLSWSWGIRKETNWYSAR